MAQGKYGINHSEWSHFSELADRVGLTSIAAQRVLVIHWSTF